LYQIIQSQTGEMKLNDSTREQWDGSMRADGDALRESESLQRESKQRDRERERERERESN